MRGKHAVIWLLGAFMLMMACTPASLRSDKKSRSEERGVRSENTIEADQTPSGSPYSGGENTLQGNLIPHSTFHIPQDSFSLSQDSFSLPQDSLIADEGPRDSVQAAVDVIRDGFTEGDSLVMPASPTTVLQEAAAKLKRDTTTMDSLELAIWKHNKAVDDSLALDSINRSRKSGIDSPVEYSANDSLTYNAAISQARLYGDSKVKYQNMDLAS